MSVPFWPERVREGQAMVDFVAGRLAAEHNDVLYVCGNCGCGKTTTTQSLTSQVFSAAVNRRAAFRYINCADLTGIDVAQRVASAMNGARQGATRAELTASIRRRLAEPEDLAVLPVIVLDEVETARPSGAQALKQVVEMALAHGEHSLALIIISNSKDLFGVDPRRLRSIVFAPYSIDDLKAIANRCAASAHIELSPFAADYAAKTIATAQYNADVRKMQALCSGAGAINKRLRPAEVAVQPSRRQPVPRQTPLSTDAAHAVPKQPCTSIADIRAALNDAPSDNVPVILTLPKQMLFLLCCCCSMERALQLQGRPGPYSYSLHSIHTTFQVSLTRHGISATSVNETRTLLHNLVDLALLSGGGTQSKFAVCVHMNEITTALAAAGPTFDVARALLAR
jgi:type II secretory pathway predicted ATPase ExeA